MLEVEDAYGLRKRLEYVRTLIERRRPASVLEIGCGSGAYLLNPLARIFPDVCFLGIDPDAASIEHALGSGPPSNLSYIATSVPQGRHDLVIASEVIEHVESPREFLVGLRPHLNPGAILFLTTPNGYGPFEIASLLQVLMSSSGLLAFLRRLWRSVRGKVTTLETVRDSYAVSPHINFFSWRDINQAIRNAGFGVGEYRARTWLCGFGLDLILRRPSFARANASIADRMSPWLVSDWMFVLEVVSGPAGPDYQRGRWARFRRALNERAIKHPGS